MSVKELLCQQGLEFGAPKGIPLGGDSGVVVISSLSSGKNVPRWRLGVCSAFFFPATTYILFQREHGEKGRGITTLVASWQHVWKVQGQTQYPFFMHVVGKAWWSQDQ